MATTDGTTEQASLSGVVSEPADAFGLVKWLGEQLVDRFTDPDASNGLRVDIAVEFSPAKRTYYTSQNGGRSGGKLHTRRDCRHLVNVPDEEIVDGTRERFDADQEVCGTCGGGC